MATQTSARTTDLLTGVEFTFTPGEGDNQAATGTVNVSTASPDAQGAVNVDLVYGAAVDGVQKATMILTAAQITTLGSSGKMNLLVEVFDSEGDSLLISSTAIDDCAPNVAPKFTIDSVVGGDNKFVITATNSNPSTYSPLNILNAAFRMMYSGAAGAGFVGIHEVAVSDNVYTLTTVVDTTNLENDVEYDIWIQGTSTLAFGAHRTNLAGVNGYKATPNNLPNAPTDLAIATNLTADDIPIEATPVTFSGKWTDTDNYDNMSYKYGRLNEAGTDFLGRVTDASDNSFVDPFVVTDSVPSAEFTFAIPEEWFNLADNSDNTILIGMTVTQAGVSNGAESRTSAMQSVTAHNPTLPSIVLSANPAVDNATGAQTFTVTTSGIHLGACPLTVQYQNGGGAPLPVAGIALTTVTAETTNSPGTANGTFALAYADITTGDVLKVRVSQADPNGGDTIFTVAGSGDFTLLKYKQPVSKDLILAASGTVGVEPTATQAGADLNGYTHMASELTAFNGYTAPVNVGDETRTLRHTSGILNITGGKVCSGSYVPGANCRANITNTYSLTATTGYAAIPDFTEDKVSAADNVLYFDSPSVTACTFVGNVMKLVGTTNGASFDDYIPGDAVNEVQESGPITGFALTSTNTGTHFTTKLGAVPVISTENQEQGKYGFEKELDFGIEIQSTGNFSGLAHLDATNANSDLQVLSAAVVE